MALLDEIFDPAGRIDLGDLGHIDALLAAPAAESVLREEHGPPPYPGAVFDADSHRWKNPHTGEEHHPDAPPLDHVADGLADRLEAAEPGITRRPGLLGKIEHAAVRAGARVYLAVLKHHDVIQGAMDRVGNVLGVVMDLPSDMKNKFGYNPSTTGPTSTGAAGHDPVRAATGVSGHIVVAVAAQVLTRAIFWAKKKLAGKSPAAAEAAAGDPLAALADLLFEAASAVAEHLGVTPPDRAAVEGLVRGAAARGS